MKREGAKDFRKSELNCFAPLYNLLENNLVGVPLKGYFSFTQFDWFLVNKYEAKYSPNKYSICFLF